MPAPVAADVGVKFDCLINGQGYMFASSDAGLPPSVFGIKNEFGYTPTFIQRQNVSGDFGDNQQDFFLTSTQRDWSLGEQQRYFRQSDADSVRRFWRSSYVDIHTPGRVAMSYSATNTTAAAGIQCVANNGTTISIFTSTNGYQVLADGTLGSAVAHGLGAAPSRYGATWDGAFSYISTTTAGTVGVRNMTLASTFSATGSDVLAYLNNTLYGYRASAGTGDLIRYDAAGAVTSLFTWKAAGGGALSYAPVCMQPFGGDLLILLNNALWLYNGTGVALIATMSDDFVADSLCVAQGIAFVGGTNGYGYPAIMYYSNGTQGLLWESDGVGGSAVAPQMVPFRNGIFFSDPATAGFLYYNSGSGGVSKVAEYAIVTQTAPMMATTFNNLTNFIVFVQGRANTDIVTWHKSWLPLCT